MSSRDDDQRHIRAAQNEVVFRQVNERIEDLNRSFQQVTELGDWICECADVSCIERIAMTLPAYEKLRSNGDHFAVKPGHEAAGLETVLERHEGYVVVAKLGVGARVAITHDPRDPTG